VVIAPSEKEAVVFVGRALALGRRGRAEGAVALVFCTAMRSVEDAAVGRWLGSGEIHGVGLEGGVGSVEGE